MRNSAERAVHAARAFRLDYVENHPEKRAEDLPAALAAPELPILFNVNVGHAAPRCIIPFGVEAVVDAGNQIIRFTE